MSALVLLTTALVSFSQQTLTVTSVKDNTLYEDNTGELSNAGGSEVIAGVTGQGGIRRAVIAFDISALPAGATITKVTLTLHQVKGKTIADDVVVHKLTKDWGEGLSNANGSAGEGAPATAGDATWIHTFYNTANWVNPGGDYEATPSASLSLTDVVGKKSWTSTQLKADVEAWVANPSENFGWILMCNETKSGTTRHFATKESLNASHKPELLIEYDITNNTKTIVSEDIFTVYPNPFTTQISLFSNEYDGIMTVKIINTRLQEVYYNEVFKNGTHINLNHLQNGIYFAIIETKKGIVTKKIIKHNN